ncbi:hypothetical protein KUV62_15710 [Salipiger bermudensis]|uniref:hypothetical protein n=1 Tax=Salipiger bermudensis TaxID=344736 RepID=UPI001C9963E4|nr:hypothetical protein [Salipiger bermudensis]MBY6005371.1 hypothetical protein [Salipiger bermudensis]
MANDALKAALLERAKREKANRVSAKAQQQAAPQADMSLMGRLKDNVVGVDDGVMSVGEKVATGLNSFAEALSLGLVGDEANAAFDAAIGRGDYEGRREKYRADQQQFREENPKTAFAVDVAPAFVPGAGAAGLAAKAGKVVGRVGAGAGLGAGAGGLYGFMEGEGGAQERAKSAATGFALGGLFGAAAPKISDAVQGLPKRVSRLFDNSQQRPSVGSLKAAKNAAYDAVDQSGFTFQPDDMQALYQRVSDAFDAQNYVEETDNASRAVLKILDRRQGTPTTLSQLDNIRKNLWSRYSGAKDQPRILDAIGQIDELVASKEGASNLMSAARAANSRFAKAQLLEDAFQKARDQTSATGSGGNILNKYRQAVTSIINDKRKSKFFSDEEIGVMRRFVEGSKTENIQRLVGKLSPSGNGLMMALHIVGGMSSGGATLPLMGVGAMSKAAADRGVQRGADNILDVVSGYRPANPAAPQLTRTQAGLITGAAPAIESAKRGLQR